MPAVCSSEWPQRRCSSPQPLSDSSIRRGSRGLQRPARHLRVLARATARATFARLPLQFEANAGQTDARVQFVTRGPGYTVFLVRRRSGRVAARSVHEHHHAGARGGGAHATARRPGGCASRRRVALAWQDELLHRQRPVQVADRRADLRPRSLRRRLRRDRFLSYGNQEQLEYHFVVAPGPSQLQIASDSLMPRTCGLTRRAIRVVWTAATGCGCASPDSIRRVSAVVPPWRAATPCAPRACDSR